MPRNTAFPHRLPHYCCGAMLETEGLADVEAGVAWSRECREAIAPLAERSNDAARPATA